MESNYPNYPFESNVYDMQFMQQQQGQGYYIQTLGIESPEKGQKREYEEEDSASSSGENKKSLSRHVSSVIKHFTSSKLGYTRLLSQVDDYLFLLSSGGQLLWVNDSFAQSLSCPDTSELINSNFSDRIHPDDRVSFIKFMSSAFASTLEHVQYLRMIAYPPSINTDADADSNRSGVRVTMNPNTFSKIQSNNSTIKSSNHTQFNTSPQMISRELPRNTTLLWEIKAKRHEKTTSSSILICSAREYKSKSSLSLDSILDLNLENMMLQTRLDQLLIKGGKNVYVQTPETDREKMGISLSVESSKEIRLYCRQCGIQDSPEWRKGPDGPKTLCNACGLSFAKKIKKLKNVQ